MSGRRPLFTARLGPHAVWAQLNRLNMSQNELARLAGITLGYLPQLMYGKRHPGPETRRLLLEALGAASFDDIFILEARLPAPRSSSRS